MAVVSHIVPPIIGSFVPEDLEAFFQRAKSDGISVPGKACLIDYARAIDSAWEDPAAAIVADQFSRFEGDSMSLVSPGCLYQWVKTLNGITDITAGSFFYETDGISNSQLSTPMNGMSREVLIDPTISSPVDNNVLFDFKESTVSGVTYAEGDDTAPARMYSRFLGAAHGYAGTEVTASSHGKTTADIGSIYSNGSESAVILWVIDSNTLLMANQTEDLTLPTGTYSHVSGGSNTGNIVASVADFQQWYPPFQDRQGSVKVDGVPVTKRLSYQFFDRVVINQSYDLLKREDIITWFIANGAGGNFQPSGLTPIARISIDYHYDVYGSVIVYPTFTVLDTISAFNSLYFAQSGIKTGDGDTKYYIPKALEFNADGTDWDFANIVNFTSNPWGIALDFTPERVESTGIYADRSIQISDNVSLAMGFLPVLDAVNRRTLASNWAMQLFTTGKIYLNAVASGSPQELTAGASYSMVVYREMFANPSNGTTAFYIVRSLQGTFVYFDFHNNSGGNLFTIPYDLVEGAYTVVEKSSNVNLSDGNFSREMTISVNNNNNGYAILKLTENA